MADAICVSLITAREKPLPLPKGFAGRAAEEMDKSMPLARRLESVAAKSGSVTALSARFRKAVPEDVEAMATLTPMPFAPTVGAPCTSTDLRGAPHSMATDAASLAAPVPPAPNAAADTPGRPISTRSSCTDEAAAAAAAAAAATGACVVVVTAGVLRASTRGAAGMRGAAVVCAA